RVQGAEFVDDTLNLADRLRFRFARNGPALDLYGRLRGVGAESGAPAQHRRMQRRRTHQRMRRAGTQVSFEDREFMEERAHFHVCVDAEVEFAAVRRAPGDLDLYPEIAFVSQADVERGRLGHDGGIYFDMADQVTAAQAAILLVGDG